MGQRRRLLHVAVIHDEDDLGSAGKAVAERSIALAGERRWAEHAETVRAFWDHVARYLRAFPRASLKIYQEGLAADGTLGRRIVERATQMGSRNYQLVLELLDGGAELRKTEEPDVLLRERQNLLLALEGERSAQRGSGAREQYRAQRDALRAERDRRIAETIRASLREGELGVLFIGADHEVAALLPDDIAVENVTPAGRIRAYLAGLFAARDDGVLDELRRQVLDSIPKPVEGGKRG